MSSMFGSLGVVGWGTSANQENRLIRRVTMVARSARLYPSGPRMIVLYVLLFAAWDPRIQPGEA